MKKLLFLIGICVMAGNIFGQDVEGDNVYVRYNIFLRDSIIAGAYSGFLSDTNDVNSRIKTFRDTLTFNASDSVTYADTARISDTALYVVGLEKDSSWVSTRTGNATSYTTIDYSGIKNYNDDEGLYLGSHLNHGELRINHPTIPNTYSIVDYTGQSFHGANKNRRFRITENLVSIEHGSAGSEVIDWSVDTNGVQSVLGKKMATENYVTSAIDSIDKKIELLLPDTIVINDSLELNIYYDNILLSNNYRNYKFNVTCDLGRAYADFYRINTIPSQLGFYPLKIEVCDYKNTILKKDSCVIVVDTGGIEIARTILLIGDSQTDQNIYPAELKSLGGATLTFIGTRDTETSSRNEGYSGQTFAWFATNAISPFRYSSAIDFQHYFTVNGYADPDVIVIALGTNDMIDATSSTLASTIMAALNNCDSLVKYIRRDAPDCKIFINTIMPPAFSEDAFGFNYTGRTQYRTKYNYFKFNQALYNKYQSSQYVEIIPTYIFLDTQHNFATQSEPYSARNSSTYTMQNNAVHPDNSGYYQEADAVFSAIAQKFHGITGSDLFSTLDGGLETCTTCTPDNDVNDNWDKWGEAYGSGKVELTATRYSGTYAAKLTYATGSSMNISMSLAVLPLHTYRLSFYTRGDGTNQSRYRVYDLTHSSDIRAITTTGISSTTYTKFSVEFTAPSGCTSIRVYGYSGSAVGSVVYFDDFSLREVF